MSSFETLSLPKVRNDTDVYFILESLDRVHTVMKSHEKPWNLKKHFPGVEKSQILGKLATVMEKSWNFIFGPNISCCMKTGNILSVIEQKYAPKGHGKF